MMATENALGISFEMAEIGEIGEIVEIGTFISPFRWCKKPQVLPVHLDPPTHSRVWIVNLDHSLLTQRLLGLG